MSLLITGSGVDCSGKTTQIDLLAEACAAQGLRTSTRWFRPGYSDRLDHIRERIRSRRANALPKAGPSDERDRIFQKSGGRVAWVIMALTDLTIEYGASLRRALLRHDVVICDRYLEDAFLDLRFRFPELSGLLEVVRAGLARVLPRPDHAVLLNLDWELQTERAIAKAEPFPDTESVRRLRYDAYQEFAQGRAFTTIDAAQSIDEVHSAILSLVGVGSKA